MPVKNIDSYPRWMVELAGEFESPTNTRRKILHLPDAQAAMRMRQQMYGFMRVLRTSPMREQYSNFLAVRVLLQGNDLTLQHVDDYLPKPPME